MTLQDAADRIRTVGEPTLCTVNGSKQRQIVVADHLAAWALAKAYLSLDGALRELIAEFRVSGDEWAAVRLETVIGEAK